MANFNSWSTLRSEASSQCTVSVIDLFQTPIPFPIARLSSAELACFEHSGEKSWGIAKAAISFRFVNCMPACRSYRSKLQRSGSQLAARRGAVRFFLLDLDGLLAHIFC